MSGSKIGFREATSLGVGGIIGAGIFVLSGTASGEAGPAVLLSFGFAFVASLILGLCYAELSSMHEDSGGPYAYAKAHLPGWVATVVGWANLGAWVCASAYVGIGFGEHMHLLVPALNPHVAASTLIVIFTLLNLLGLRVSGRVQFLVMLLEIGVLLLFIGIGAVKIDPSLYHPFVAHGMSGIFAAALIGFLSLTGWDAIVVAAEEIERPRRNIPLSILTSLAIVFVLYGGLLLVVNGLIRWDQLGRSTTPVADAANLVLGHLGEPVIDLVIVIALTATTNAFVVVISRTAYVLARDNRAPAVVARTWSESTPWVAILLAGTSQIGMAVFSNLRFAVSATGFLYTITFIASVVALFVARSRGRQADFRVPWYPVVPALALALCFGFISGSGRVGVAVGTAWIGLGLGCAALTRRSRRPVPAGVLGQSSGMPAGPADEPGS
ncbi:MAG TPA: APC family permease [Mycobacteriales bacterium]|nr:APC family permease [Mycobacteriales bacterium]